MSNLPVPVVFNRGSTYLVFTVLHLIRSDMDYPYINSVEIETYRALGGVVAYLAALYWQTYGDTKTITHVWLFDVPHSLQTAEPDVRYLRVDDLAGLIEWVTKSVFVELQNAFNSK